MDQYKLFWGDAHTNLRVFTGDCEAELTSALEHARKVLDFWPIAYYPCVCKDVSGFPVEDWRSGEQLEAHWNAVSRFAAAHNRDGELVVFAGYEWQGDARWGDHNVFFLDDHAPMLCSKTLQELYAEIRTRKLRTIAIPHHTAYRAGVRSKDWSVHDEAISPFAEIFSHHGCSESDEEWIGLRRNPHMGPGVTGGTIEDGLNRGLKFGIIASADSHYGLPGVYGWGLMGAYAEQLSREALWEAFLARRVYAVTGDRIELDFRTEDAFMGSEIRKKGPLRAIAQVRGSDAIDRIELLRNNRVIAVHTHSGTWAAPTAGKRIRCKVRVEVGWGPTVQDIPDAPPREWDCSIEVRDGAVLGAEPCWKTAGQWIGEFSSPGPGPRCEFGFRTAQSPPHGELPTEATIFELEARPDDALTITVNGKVLETTLAEAMCASRIIDFRTEAAQYVRKTHGIDPEDLPRPDRIYFYSHKVKIHRAIPECGFATALEHVDVDPPAGLNHYRVRVFQRNGHTAWSSPIWVENE